MGIVLDLILVAVIILVVVLAAKRGIITAIIGVVAFILAIFLASTTAQPVAEMMYKAFFYKNVQRGIYETLPSNVSALNFADKAQIVMDNIPDFAKNYATKSGLSLSKISSEISQNAIKSDSELYVNLEEKIVKPIAVLVLKHIMFYVLAVVFAIILKLLANVLCKSLKDREFIGKADSIIGAVIGLAEGLVIVFLLCCLLSYLKPKYENPKIIEAVNDSSIVAMTNDLNPMNAISAGDYFAEQ